jgi:hypothetical protein
MIRIADLLDCDFYGPVVSGPVDELVEIGNDDPDIVFRELTEYIATDGITAEYERLFAALAAAPKSPDGGTGVWISGYFGSGKSSFAKNAGYVLADCEVRGASASSLFLKRLQSRRVTECVEFLNRTVPYEIFLVDLRPKLPVETAREQIPEVMYRVLLRDLDYAADRDIAELEIELEKEGRLAAFEDLCRDEYREEWRTIRKGNQKLARCSALLYQLDPRTYAATDTWLNMIQARPSPRLSGRDLVERLFDLCEIRRAGKTFAFILDEITSGAASLESLRALVEQFGRESLARRQTGKLPGPAWIIVTAQQKLTDLADCPAAIVDRFRHRIDLSAAGIGEGIGEVVARRVLRKKESHEFLLRELFRKRGASLIQNVRLERSSRRTEFDEDRFVRFYPYLPHLIDLSLDIIAGIRRHPQAPGDPGNLTIVRQSFEMLVSDRTRLAEQPLGVLVSIDRIYELVEGNIPPETRQNIVDIRRRFDDHEDYPQMAGRVAKAICLMEFAQTDLPRTTKNIAALLIQRVTEAPPALAVAEILPCLKEAQFVRETADGWKLYDRYEPRRAAAVVEALKKAVGTLNPRLPGWHNDLIQSGKKLMARALGWYTRPLHEFNASVSRSLEEIVWAIDHLSANSAAPDHLALDKVTLDRLAADIMALDGRLAQSEQRIAKRTATPAPANFRCYIDPGLRDDRTAYIIGLFGTGRRYINELMQRHIGERAQYFRDAIRVHPGPTPMIYSGHATMRHVSRAQELPVVMSRISEAVELGFADVIFIYRHPLDSLLTNWIWWRTYIQDNKSISGISQVYANTDDLCADLEQNFLEFEAFAEGDPDFFAAAPGPRFLSFQEFAEETELHLQSATLALRLEDFTIDPRKEFSRIAEVMSVELDLSRLCLKPPRTRAYGYLAVKDKVPRFRNFIHGLDAETKRRIEKIGYSVGT